MRCEQLALAYSQVPGAPLRIPRIYVDLPLSTQSVQVLPDMAFHHLCKVLRLKDGHPIVLFDGRGGEYEATLIEVEKRTAKADVGAFRPLDNESPLKVTVGQCLSRGERMDYAIQKAVENGVHNIQPLFSERCEVKLNEGRLEKRLQHWQQVAISAAEQSGRGWVPQILSPMDLSTWVEECNEMLKIVLHHHCPRPLRELSKPANGEIALLVGPEGGLTETEVALAQAHDFSPVALGPRVLRTETAPVVALSALHLLWGDFN